MTAYATCPLFLIFAFRSPYHSSLRLETHLEYRTKFLTQFRSIMNPNGLAHTQKSTQADFTAGNIRFIRVTPAFALLKNSLPLTQVHTNFL